MLGPEPGLPDALAYYLVWFLRDRMAEGDQFLLQFENLVGWEQRVKDIGHGNPEEMGDLEALDIAKNAAHNRFRNDEFIMLSSPLGRIIWSHLRKRRRH